MDSRNILYEIKTLEKMITREFIKDINFTVKKVDFVPTPTQMQIIGYIIEHNGQKIYQKDLENILSLRRATVSGVLKTMEKNKLIKRNIDTNDTRIKEIILEEKAKEIFQIKQKKVEELEKKLISDIEPEKIKVFSEVLGNMIKKLEENNTRKEDDNIC